MPIDTLSDAVHATPRIGRQDFTRLWSYE